MMLAWIRSLDECKVRSFTRLTRPHPRPLTLFSATFEPLCAVGLISSFLMHGVSRSVLEVSYPIAWTTDRAHEFLLDIRRTIGCDATGIACGCDPLCVYRNMEYSLVAKV